jgi:hypothetical protein
VKYGALIALIATALPASAQIIQNVPPPSSSALPWAYDCSHLPYQSEGCKSYNEMISKGDKDLASALKGDVHAFVCFRPGEDAFVLVSFSDPAESAFTPDSPKAPPRAYGYLTYVRIKSGVTDDVETPIGRWTRWPEVGPSAFFSTPNNVNPTATISDTEIDYNHSYKNLAGTTTQYSLQIRRSTLRFTETYTFPEPATPAKSKQPQTATHSENQSTTTGYCTEFQPPSQP